jgi:hypothetical protein
MARDYVDQRATRTRVSAETRGRRTKPEDHRPYSPEQIDALYSKGEYSPFHKTAGDGLVDAKQHKYDVMIQKPQFPEDQHGPGYNPDVPITRWVRGADATKKPGYVFTGDPKGPKGPPCKASGADISESPFSAAHLSNERGRK